MKKTLIFLYGVSSYAAFFAAFLYWIAFMADAIVPKSINTGTVESIPMAIAINVALLMVFAVQHTIMARQGFKQWITRYIPESMERSTYVLVATLCVILLFWQWQPLGGELWHVTHPVGQALIWGVFALGWVILLLSTFLINHFELFGLQQVFERLRSREFVAPRFRMPMLYRVVRHPMMVGILVASWATPHMTGSHLMFALAMTGYILVGIWFEEKDLVRRHGESYVRYQKNVPALIPRLKPVSPEAVGEEAPAN